MGNMYYNDIWTLNLTTNVWKLITTTSSSPVERSTPVSIISNGKMIIFGGYDGTNRKNDVWSLDLMEADDTISTSFYSPHQVCFDNNNNMLITDTDNHVQELRRASDPTDRAHLNAMLTEPKTLVASRVFSLLVMILQN